MSGTEIQAADMTDFDQAMDEFLPNVAERFCPECGAAVPRNATGRPKKFCSARCRNLWWAKHPKPEHWSSARMKTCPICGKPKPGMLLRAAADFNIDLERSWMVGDGENDIEAGKNAGCKTAYIKREEIEVEADMTVESLLEFVEKTIL